MKGAKMSPRFATRFQLGGGTGRMFAAVAALPLAEPFFAGVAFGFALVAVAAAPRPRLAGFSSSTSYTTDGSSSWPSSST
jgi:hypothetical protein